MCFGILGGVENRWECLISGPCIHELSDCLDDAPSINAVMTAQCLAVLQENAKQPELEEDKINETAADSIILDRPLVQYAVTLQMLASGNARLVEVVANARPTLKKQVSFVAARDAAMPLSERQKLMSDTLVCQFVPVPIVEELNGAIGLSYFAEIREVVTMFMKVRSIHVRNCQHCS
jgi:hypothetical protein